MKCKYSLLLLLIGFSIISKAQMPQKLNSVELFEKVQKLNFLGSVLYVAAHPDDENTKLITYFSNQYHAQTAYLSLTRGDGGQNLIGSELGYKLGAIRTQELLAARKIDGGLQFFTRANDFGFSKEPNETFAIWNKEQVLEDVKQLIETFKPDIIINRFDHRTSGNTHGHHTASAILSLEALQTTKHQPHRFFFNTSWWFYGSQENFEKADKSNLLNLQTNVFYPLKGKSNNEIAALSRSQHRCQGFGTLGTRGTETEYLELLKGEKPKSDNLFEGIDTKWTRIKGGKEIGIILEEVEKNFNFLNPSVHVPQLLKAYSLVEKIDDTHWKNIKLAQLKELIELSCGLYFETLSSENWATQKDKINLNIEVINRSSIPIRLKKIEIGNNLISSENAALENNVKFSKKITDFEIKQFTDYSNLFWLNEPFTSSMYQVSNSENRNLAEINIPFPVNYYFEIDEKELIFTKNLSYKTNNPDFGETYLPFTILPEVTSTIQNKVVIFSNNESKKISVKIQANTANCKGYINLKTTSDWKISPEKIDFEILQKNDSKTVEFTITPQNKEALSEIEAQIQINGKMLNQELITIAYPHIPTQTILQKNKAKLVKIDIVSEPKNIGYISGAGDEVANCLENLGHKITLIKPEEIKPEYLTKFEVIFLGIRAFNVLDELAYKNKILFDFVKNGGNLIVQYNTNTNLVTKEIAPYPLQISKERVTNENATVSFLNPKHLALQKPNKITEKDFSQWIQEQGLYYPEENWDANFEALISSNDAGETPKKGALLIAKYGKGNYIYTGLSFFRQLPEGVPGAYRLLANLISLKN